MDSYRANLVERLIEHWDRMRSASRPRAPREWTDLELTMPQARILVLLSSRAARMTEIASHLERGLSSATTMIDRLVSKGLVERAEDPADRRVVTCALTSVGENAVERFMRIGRHKIESIADALSVEELEIVTHAMEIMADAAGRAPAAVASEDQEPASMKA